MIKKNNLHNLEQVDTLVFDIDYTIIRYISYKELKSQNKIYLFPIIDDLFVMMFKMINDSKYFESFYNKFTYIKNKLGINGKFIVSIIRDILKRYIVVYPDISEVIEFLKKDYIINCFTDFCKETAEMELEIAGISDIISNIYVSEAGMKKINLIAHSNLLIKLNRNPENVIIIGNSIVDIHSSQLGINTILMDYDDKALETDDKFKLSSAVVTSACDLKLLLKK